MLPSSCIGVARATMLPVMGVMGAGDSKGGFYSEQVTDSSVPGRLAHGGDALDEAAGPVQEPVLVRHHAQAGAQGQQFAMAQQEIRPRRLADGLVALGERFVKQHAAWADAGD